MTRATTEIAESRRTGFGGSGRLFVDALDGRRIARVDESLRCAPWRSGWQGSLQGARELSVVRLRISHFGGLGLLPQPKALEVPAIGEPQETGAALG